jgi:isoleucyl-tRNA synthetase
MSPVLSFTAEEAWEYLPAVAGREEYSAMASFAPFNESWRRPDLDDKWDKLIKVRGEMTKVLELARQEKVIGHPLEAEVSLKVDGELGGFLADNWDILKTIAIVSELHRVDDIGPEAVISEELPELAVLVKPAAGTKCERCWTRAISVGDSTEHPLLCKRCVGVVDTL